jgi:hypothetical protein
MAELRGGSLVGGWPIMGKSASENAIPKVKGNLLVNSLLSDDGVKVTSTGDIYVKVAGVDKKVFHEGNLVASGSSTQDFTTKILSIYGHISQDAGNVGANNIKRNSTSPALYVDQHGAGDILHLRPGNGPAYAVRVANDGNIYVNVGGTDKKVFHEGNLVAAGSTSQDFSARALTVGMTINMTAANAGIEMGSTTAANTPFIDFHSSGIANDWDARIIANGGTTGSSTGDLKVHAKGFYANVVGGFVIPVGVDKWAT